MLISVSKTMLQEYIARNVCDFLRSVVVMQWINWSIPFRVIAYETILHDMDIYTVYPQKYAHGFCFAVLCCGYTLTDFPISIRLTSLANTNTSCEFIMNDCITTTKQSTTKPCAYFLGYTVSRVSVGATIITTKTPNITKPCDTLWDMLYSISQEICTRFCCALLCCGYVIVHNEFIWSIYPYSSGLLCWHWGNR